jgi:hypothetical protein
MNSILGRCAVVAGVAFTMQVVQAESKYSDATFAAVKAAVPPYPGEDKFTSIPWQTNLWEARTKAAAEGKPILLWEMDGNPLGCG